MKKIFIIIVLVTFTATSCKKSFLDLAPEDAYTDVNYYKTEAQFKAAVVAAYAPLRDVLLNDYFTSEMHSDNTVYQPIPSNRGTAYLERENISDFRNTSTNAYVAATWQHSYTGISRCNIVIERLKSASLSAGATASIDGQAKFLRALNYFKLVRLFGGVPLFLKEVTKADDAFLPRSTEAEVYSQIILDAKDAITELAAPVFTANKQTGEATKGAATMLLAEVYATQKKWAEAEGQLLTLSAMGYQLNALYSDAFTAANKNSRESIFEVQYLEGTTTGTTPNIIPTHFLPRASTNTALVTGVAVTNNGTGGWNTPSTDLINTFEAGDKRLDLSIGIVEGAYNGSDLLVYSANKSIIGYVAPAGKIGVPYIKKYLLSTFTTNTGSSVDFPIYRYSDALLLLAEAQNEQGKSPLTSLNLVRTRAGLANTTSTDPAVLRTVIAHERRVELAFENHRWHDLVRTGNAVAVINAFGVVARAQLPYLASDAYVVDAHDLLFPLPQTDVGLNPALGQNPGY
jgi:hypothetical protein